MRGRLQYIYEMNKNYATIHITHAIDGILDRGAGRLYDHYLTQKLPENANMHNTYTLTHNLNTHVIAHSKPAIIQTRPSPMPPPLGNDNIAPKRLQIKQSPGPQLRFSPK